MSTKFIACPKCQGKGKIVQTLNHINFPKICDHCKGKGKIKGKKSRK